MNLEQLKQLFKAMNVTFKDDFTLKRAILYYEFVERIHASLTTGKIKQELSRISGGYQKVEPALTKSGLLTGLCKILDEYFVPAVNSDLRRYGATYGQYFESVFKSYPDSVATFLNVYPNTTQALAKISAYFEQNILTACKRILDDWSYLQGMFVDQKSSFLDQLIDIRSTGSDFHKGGQQVLLLTFSTKPAGPPLRIVYKPSDLEVDCLIIGNTQAVNIFRPNFQQASLMELLNELIKTRADLALNQFPTYKILPISPGSQLRRDATGRLPLRDSYGYIQFLEYDGIKPFPEDDGTCLRFYALLGQLTAVACTFSLSDLHTDNLIVHQHLPYLIDLENSLTRLINRLSDTELIADRSIEGGAIDGVVLTEHLSVGNDNTKEVGDQERYHRGKNRLWQDPQTLIGTAKYSGPMLQGFTSTMDLIRHALQSGNPFGPWFTRLKQGAIVRIVPLGTNAFQETNRYLFSPKNKQDVRTGARQEMERHLSTGYGDWAKAPAATLPLFLCLQQQYVINDIINFDIPVFYHQLNTSDVLDSNGTTITVPDTVTIGSASKPVSTLLHRTTLFPSPPLDTVQTVQLGDTNHGNTSPTKVKELSGEFQAAVDSDKDVVAYKELADAKRVDNL